MKKIIAIVLMGLSPLLGYATSCENIVIGVEYLYMKPSINDPYFAVPIAVVGDNRPIGTRFGNFFPYHSGVRVNGLYNLPCSWLDFYVDGFYLRDREQRTLSFEGNGGGLTKGFPPFNPNGITEVTSQSSYRLWFVKGGLRYSFTTPCPFLISLRFAVQYANLSNREKINSLDIGDDMFFTDASMHSWALGPEGGFDIGYQIFPCFTFMVRGSYALLAGRMSTSEGDAQNEEIAFASNEKKAFITPTSELKLGFNYDLPFNCFDASLEIGYDFIYYNHMLNHIRWVNEPSYSFDHTTPFMVHGLYVSLCTGF